MSVTTSLRRHSGRRGADEGPGGEREGVQLLLDKGIQYDHSSQAHDCMPFYCRDEDTWTKIDYSAESVGGWLPWASGDACGH